MLRRLRICAPVGLSLLLLPPWRTPWTARSTANRYRSGRWPWTPFGPSSRASWCSSCRRASPWSRADYPGQERGQHHDEEHRGLFHGLPWLLDPRFRHHVRQRQQLPGHHRLLRCGGHGRPVLVSELDVGADPDGMVLPIGVLRHRRHHRFRRHGGADPIFSLSDLQLHHFAHLLSHGGALDLGRWMAGGVGHAGFRRLHGGPFHRCVVRSRRRHRARAPTRQIQPGRKALGDSGSQSDARHPGRVDPVVRLVRIQPRKHHGRGRQRHFAHGRQYQPGGRRRGHRSRVDRVDDVRQTRSHDDSQRRPGRPRGHHLRVRLRGALGRDRLTSAFSRVSWWSFRC